MVKKLILVATATASSFCGFAQSDDIKVKISGYVKADYWIDTRKHSEGVDGLFSYFPLAPEYDAAGTDLNDVPTANLSALSTRLRLHVAGPDLFGAKANAIVETDFTGTNDVALLRIRLANLTLSWKKATLIVGQAWHPFVIPQFIPRTVGINMAAPFQPFNRNPQVTYTYKFDNGFKLLGSLNYQSSYESFGPNGKSSIYLRNALLPNLDFQVSKAFGKSTLGVAYDYKMLRPAISNVGADGKKYKNSNTVSSSSFLAYYNYTSDKLFVLVKQIYAENMSEFLMQGGYAVSSTNPLTGVQEYTPSKGSSTLLNISYGTQYRIGGTFGYFANGGFKDNIQKGASTYTRAVDLKQLYRIAPHFIYTNKNLMLSFEAEYNRAYWGKVNYDDKGKIVDANAVNGFRFLTSLQYNF